MENHQVPITSEWIKLDSLLKFAGACDTGGEAKIRIISGEIKVNNEICTMRGKKIYPQDTVQIEDTVYTVIKK